MKTLIRYIKAITIGSGVATLFVTISSYLLFSGRGLDFFLPYYCYHGAIFGFIFISLLLIVENYLGKTISLYPNISYQLIGVTTATLVALFTVILIFYEEYSLGVYTGKGASLTLEKELRNFLIFICNHMVLGWFTGMIIGKINKK